MNDEVMTTQDAQSGAPSAEELKAFNEAMNKKNEELDEADALDAYVFNYKTVKGEQVRSTLKKCNRNIETYILDRDLLYDFRYNEFAEYAERRGTDGNYHRITDKDLLYLIDRIYQEAEKEDGERKPLTAFKGFDINNDKDWQNYCKTINKYGADKVSEMYQGALDILAR